MPAVQAKGAEGFVTLRNEDRTPPAAPRPYGTLCSDAFGLHAYGLRPPTVDS